jgi:peptidyl-prolyl cis-trans isomerase SurA
MNFNPTSLLQGVCALALTAVVIVPLAGPAHAADEAERVAAVVNDDVISVHDLDQRLKLVMMSSNLPDSVETRSRVMPQVIRRLIDEHLELQEARKQKVEVESGEIANALGNIERQNNMPHGTMEKLLRAHDVDPETLRQQIKADLAWNETVRQELTRDIHVGDDAINTRLDNLKANIGKPEYLAGEIFLAVDGPRNEEQVKSLAERLIEQLRNGAPFQSLAQQFSQNGGGGQLGWVSEGMLDDELMRALGRLQVNSITPPIRANDGYHILLLIDKRKIGDGLSSGPSVDLLTLELNSLPSATFPERDAQLQRFKQAMTTVRGCDNLEKASKEMPSTGYSRVDKVAEAGLPPEVLTLISKLEIGQLSEPLDMVNSRRFFAVCGRADQPNGLPSYDDIKRRMENEQLENLAKRYLRDLRRNAYVDVRI